MPLESDVQNPDAGLWVEFSREPVENTFRSQQEGHPVFEERDLITIRIPGDNLNVIVRPVTEEDKSRFPRHWALFQSSNSNEGVIGTIIDEWPAVTRSVAKQLRYAGFKTVEQIAAASDASMMKLGMACGMAPLTFRDKAKAYLASAASTAEAQAAIVERDEMRQRIADLEAAIARAGVTIEAPKRRGRPPKEDNGVAA